MAAALKSFGLVDMAMVARGTKARLESLRSLRLLTADDTTLEARIHEVVEGNLWVFGSEYALLSSNQVLQTMMWPPSFIQRGLESGRH